MAQKSKEARRAAAEYAREWRKKNPDKNKEACARYWEKKAAAAARTKEGATNAAAV